jgi:hypothetical protein
MSVFSNRPVKEDLDLSFVGWVEEKKKPESQLRDYMHRKMSEWSQVSETVPIKRK